MPKVSVIIPVYNTEKYIEKCLESVCNQTLFDIEIICIDDCSTDNSLNILKEYAQKDSRIKLIEFKENKGAAVARNTGIDQATGEYIGFVDSDDFIDLDFYEKLYNKAKEQNFDVAKGCIKLYDPQNDEIKNSDWLDLNHLIKKHKAYFYFTFTSAIYKTDIIKKNNIHFIENFIHAEDPYFTIKANIFYKTIVLVENATYYYVENKTSTSRNFTKRHAQNQAEASILILDLLNKSNIDKQHYLIVLNFVFKQMLEWCNNQNITNEMLKISVDGLQHILENCKYKNELLEYHFLLKKEEAKYNIFKKLRENAEKNLNSNLKNKKRI